MRDLRTSSSFSKLQTEPSAGAIDSKTNFNSRDKQRGIFNFLTWSFFIAEALGLHSAFASTGRPGDGDDAAAKASQSVSDVSFASMAALPNVAPLADGPAAPAGQPRPLDDQALNGAAGPDGKPPLKMPNIDNDDWSPIDPKVSGGGGGIQLEGGDGSFVEYNFTNVQNNLNVTEINISDNDTIINIDTGDTINQVIVVGVDLPGEGSVGADAGITVPGVVDIGAGVDLGPGGLDVSVGVEVAELAEVDIDLGLGAGGLDAGAGVGVADLANIDVELALGAGGLDAGVGVGIANVAEVDIDLGLGAGGLDADVSVGVAELAAVGVDLGLGASGLDADVSVGVAELAEIDLGLGLGAGGLDVNAGVDLADLAEVDVGLDIGSSGAALSTELAVADLASLELGLDIGSGGIDLDLDADLPAPVDQLASGVLDTVEFVVDESSLAPLVDAVLSPVGSIIETATSGDNSLLSTVTEVGGGLLSSEDGMLAEGPLGPVTDVLSSVLELEPGPLAGEGVVGTVADTAGALLDVAGGSTAGASSLAPVTETVSSLLDPIADAGSGGEILSPVADTVASVLDLGSGGDAGTSGLPVVEIVGGTLGSLLGSVEPEPATTASSDLLGSGGVVLDEVAEADVPQTYEMYGQGAYTDYGLAMTSEQPSASSAQPESSGGLLDVVGSILGGEDANADAGFGGNAQNVSLPSVAEEISVRGLVDSLL